VTTDNPENERKIGILEVIVHILAWGTRIFFILSIIIILFFAPIYLDAPDIIVPAGIEVGIILVIVLLLEKILPQRKNWTFAHWKDDRSIFKRSVYRIDFILFWIIAIGIGSFTVIALFSAVFNLYSQNPLLFILAIGSVPILVSILEWIMKHISK